MCEAVPLGLNAEVRDLPTLTAHCMLGLYTMLD